MKKIIGFMICMFLVSSTGLSAVGFDENKDKLTNDYIGYNSNFPQSLNQADDWPMFQHDLNHCGYSTANTPDTVGISWAFFTAEVLNATWVELSSSPAIVDENIYFGTYEYYEGEPCGEVEGGIFCLSSDEGDVVWYHRTEDMVYLSSPVIEDGKLYIGSFDTKIHCLDIDDGEELWNYSTEGDITSSPAIVNDKVYFGSQDNKVYCLDADMGTKLWDFSSDDKISSSPAINNGKVYIGSDDGKVYCLNASTGSKIWEFDTGALHVPSSPSIANGKVYIGAYNNKVYCLDADNGDIIWEYDTDYWVYSSPAVAYGRVYIGSMDDNVYCLDADNGTKLWDFVTDDDIISSIAIADGKVYFGSLDTKLYCLNATTGSKLWDYATNGYGFYSSPAIGEDGIIYIGELDGTFYAFGAYSNQPPYTPSDPDPSDGATNVDINADLSWNCSDPDGDDLTYDVYFEADDPTPDELVSENQSENIYDPGTMEYGTQYYWKIVAWDNNSQSTGGPVWDFTTTLIPNDPPYPPSNPYPTNGSTNVNIDTVLSWNCSDPDPEDILTYDVYFEANDSTPDNLIAKNISDNKLGPMALNCETTYYWRIIVKDNHGASTWGPVWHFTTTAPDLDCEGSLSWTNVKPGETVEGSFTVRNIGGPVTMLDWEIVDYPSWGYGSSWTFTPKSGEDLTPEDGPMTVGVKCVTPDVKNKELDGEITVQNLDNPDDFCTIDVSLTTPKNKPFVFNFLLLNWLFEVFPNAFPRLRYLVGQ